MILTTSRRPRNERRAVFLYSSQPTACWLC
jgi:hypothetical protein